MSSIWSHLFSVMGFFLPDPGLESEFNSQLNLSRSHTSTYTVPTKELVLWQPVALAETLLIVLLCSTVSHLSIPDSPASVMNMTAECWGSCLSLCHIELCWDSIRGWGNGKGRARLELSQEWKAFGCSGNFVWDHWHCLWISGHLSPQSWCPAGSFGWAWLSLYYPRSDYGLVQGVVDQSVGETRAWAWLFCVKNNSFVCGTAC